MNKEIIKRWNERVIANGWDKMGAEGAKAYLEKYGKNISNEKLLALADYAREISIPTLISKKLIEFEIEMRSHMKNLPKIKEVTRQYAQAQKFNEDAINQFDDGDEEGGREVMFFESTVGILAANYVGSACGAVPNHCFIKIATKFPDVEVRGCLDKTTNSTGCVEMKVDDEKMGEKIEELADKGGGSFRFDGDGANNSWEYFETE